MGDTQIVVYGTVWCGHSRRARQLLESCGVGFRWVDIDQDAQGRRMVEEINRGFRSVPTIVFADGSVLVEPSDEQLRRKLGI